MKDEAFVEASANIRILEKKLLSTASINRLMEAPNALETLRQISQNSEYDFSSLKKPEDYEDVLKDGLKKTYSLMYRISPDRRIVDIPAAKYDFHNLRAALKSKYIGKDMSRIYVDVTGLDISDSSTMPEYLSEAMAEAADAYSESKDPQIIDVVIDRHMFAYILSLCEAVKNDFITEYTRLSIDFHNIKTLVRVKNMRRGTRFLNECLIPGGLTDKEYFLQHYDKSPDTMASVFYYKYFGDIMRNGIDSYAKTGNFSGLEKLFDDHLVEYTKKSKYSAFGPEVLFAYIMSKENELRQIRILVTCKLNDIRAEILRERLRDNYA